LSGRTPEERERARLEREARRAAREGRKSPPQAPEPQAGESPAVAATEVRPPAPPPPFEERPPAPRSLPPRPRAGKSAAERRAAARDFLQQRRGDGSSWRPSVAIVAVAGGLAAPLIAWFLLSLFQPLKGDGSGNVAVTIPSGATLGQIADLLEERDVVSSSFFFRARATLAGRGDDFKAGKVPMRRDMSYGAAMDLLANPPAPDTVAVTIPEGLSRSEAKGVIGDVLSGDYVAASRRSSVLDPADYGAKGASSLEGFLFPATYELKPKSTVRELVDRQLVTFKRELANVDMSFAKRKNLNAYDVLIIASMVEREAQLDKERKLIASVIYNRLSQGIPLGIDATIRFATGNWSEPLKQSELAIDSGYNTRLNQGLPHGPIGNPGIASIQAAAHPARTGFLYYVVKPGACGEHSFSETDAEFQRDVERYNSERAARGGKSPTDC
jgi:UPF0755 protein